MLARANAKQRFSIQAMYDAGFFLLPCIFNNRMYSYEPGLRINDKMVTFFEFLTRESLAWQHGRAFTCLFASMFVWDKTDWC